MAASCGWCAAVRQQRQRSEQDELSFTPVLMVRTRCSSQWLARGSAALAGVPSIGDGRLRCGRSPLCSMLIERFMMATASTCATKRASLHTAASGSDWQCAVGRTGAQGAEGTPSLFFASARLATGETSFWLISGEGLLSPELRYTSRHCRDVLGLRTAQRSNRPARAFSPRDSLMSKVLAAHAPLSPEGIWPRCEWWSAVEAGECDDGTWASACAHSPATGRYFALGHRTELHEGVDLVAPLGTAVHAASATA